jgi:hypothetical protein
MLLSLRHLVKSVTCCFLAGSGEDWGGTGEGVSIGLFVPDAEDPPASDVVASDGWTAADTDDELLATVGAVELLAGGLTFDGGMREAGREGGRVSPDCAKLINFMA